MTITNHTKTLSLKEKLKLLNNSNVNYQSQNELKEDKNAPFWTKQDFNDAVPASTFFAKESHHKNKKNNQTSILESNEVIVI